MTTAYTTHPRLVQHTLPGHVEHAGRLRTVWQVLADSGLLARLDERVIKPATQEALLSVHTRQHLDLLGAIEASGRAPALIDADTYFAPDSYSIARLAAGAALTAVDAVMTGSAANALCAVRPPGHHATPSRAMGFCLLNNVAVAARWAQQQHRARRVMIVDYDVHHGNGTQDVFYDDDSVLFLSTHQHPLYPGTGHLDEIGAGPGEGTTVNVPMSAGMGDDAFAQVFTEVVWPVARRFQPDLLLVSAGYDAHHADPLGGQQLTLRGFAHLSRDLVAMAGALCAGRVVFVMEGGYDLDAVSHGVANSARALLGLPADTVTDPLGEAPANTKTDASAVIEAVRRRHNL